MTVLTVVTIVTVVTVVTVVKVVTVVTVVTTKILSHYYFFLSLKVWQNSKTKIVTVVIVTVLTVAVVRVVLGTYLSKNNLTPLDTNDMFSMQIFVILAFFKYIYAWFTVCHSSLTRPWRRLSRLIGLHALAPSGSKILKLPLSLLAFRQFKNIL